MNCDHVDIVLAILMNGEAYLEVEEIKNADGSMLVCLKCREVLFHKTGAI